MADWYSWHLHVASTAPGAAETAVTQVVGPAVAALDRRRWFFIRYWQAGPHVRLRVSGLDPAGADALTADLTTRLAPVNDAIPVSERVTGAGYRAAAAPLAALGEGAGALAVAELAPPGVHRAVYEPEYERYGGADLMALTEDLFHASSAVALRVCRDRRGTGRRVADGLEAMAATVSAWPGDPLRLLAGIREGWRAWSGTDVPVPEDRVRAVAPALRALVAGAPSRWTPWTDRLRAAAGVWTDRLGTARAGQVFGSHLHMTQNRLGVGGAEARLAALLLSALRPDTAT